MLDLIWTPQCSQQRIQQTIDNAKQSKSIENGNANPQQQQVANNQNGPMRHQVQHIPIDKEKIDSFEKEVISISDQIKFKKEYFEKIQEKILNKIDLSSF